MGCAFDIKKMTEYQGEMHGYDIVENLERLKIKNLMKSDKEWYHTFCSELAYDYNERKANFLAYTREGMDARVLWELRKSAILWGFMEGDIDPWFFEGHKEGWGVFDIKAYRSRVLRTKFRDYDDHDWQYFWVLDTAYGRDYAREYFDAEMCFEDRDEFKVDDLGDPPRDLAWRLVPVSTYEMKCRQGTPEWVKPIDITKYPFPTDKVLVIDHGEETDTEIEELEAVESKTL